MMSLRKNIVIGSGASALGAILGLIERGESDILVLDQGNQMGHIGQRNKLNFASASTSQQYLIWQLVQQANQHNSQIVEKNHWGDSYVYDGSNEFTGFTSRDLLGSLALGGLSKVWGTAICTYDDLDLNDWPIKSSDLKGYYDYLRKVIPIVEIGGEVKTNSHLEKIFSNKQLYVKNNISVANATVALDQKLCSACGMCLTGCFVDALFSTETVIKNLIAEKKIQYFNSITVDRISPVDDFFEVRSKNAVFTGKNIYVGTGCLHSTKLLAEYLPSSEKIFLQETAYLLVPAFSFCAEPKTDQYIPVVQKFLRFQNIHVQVYGYNQHIKYEIYNKLPQFLFFRESLAEKLARHILIFQIFFDSRDSYKIELQCKDKSLRIVASSILPQFEERKAQLFKALRKTLFSSGVIFLSGLQRHANIGRSFHYGGTLPMNRITDIWGRIGGRKGLFVVDSSTFPTIPSRTILYTTMANAMRIAKEAPLND